LSPERLLSSGWPTSPNPDCPVCGVVYTTAYVDFSKATLNDLVEEFIKTRLRYGDKEISISNEVGILYDPDETENLDKQLSELGIKDESFLTVVDEEDDDTFVNVVISVQQA
jgi:ubiquitin-like 1-activating enzyme E1 B